MSIFSRVRGKVQGYQADINPHDWRLPTSYSSSSKSGKITIVPDPSIFRNALIPKASVAGTPEGSLVYPDISHAAVHLVLLECFRNLRHSAAALGIKSTAAQLPSYDFLEKPKRSPTFDGESDSEQWNLLIHLAITRFETWWTNIEQIFKHASAYTHLAGNHAVVQLTKDYLPPLDVLLVWYAFMLDSERYAKACHECNMPHLMQLCFPWPAIKDVIDMENMTYTISRPAESLFKTLTEQEADILKYINAPPAYSETSILSPSIDFYGLVKKQEAFMDLSHKLLWIRSPAVVGSLDRSCIDYLEAQATNDLFFMPVHALPFGLELIWRTHRLYPAQYLDFRDSGSDLAPPDTGPADQDGSEPRLPLADKKPNSKPDKTICVCWTCERIRDDLPSYALPQSDEARRVSSTASSSTIPSTSDQISTLSSEQLRQIQDDLAFYHAVENARKSGLQLPTRAQTPKEKEAEKAEKRKRESLGRLPGLNEYVEVGKDGKKKIKVSKYSRSTYGMGMLV